MLTRSLGKSIKINSIQRNRLDLRKLFLQSRVPPGPVRVQQIDKITRFAGARDKMSGQPVSFPPFSTTEEFIQFVRTLFPKEDCSTSADIKKV